jgi:[acyl-carrier-protein] S-malonyltransferase
MTLALLCSGQGKQHADMFRLTAALPAAQPLFAHAAALLGDDPRALVHDGAQDIFENRTAQVLCTLQALAAHAALHDALPRRLCLAGYSVGELAAWGVARVWAPETALDLAAARADAMTAAAKAAGTRPQGMLFLRGLAAQRIARLCEGRDAAPAIVSPGDAYVIGGTRAALDLIAAEAAREGATNVAGINVAVASHTRFMAAAVGVFETQLRAAPRAAGLAPGIRLISGIDGAAVLDLDAGLVKLARQVEQTIHWDACLQACVEAGATAFLELGPGRALAAMAASTHPGIPARSLDDFDDLADVPTWLERVSRA